MTEKRFVGRYAGRTIKKLIGIEGIETNRVCVTIEENIRLLNEINDENEQLKQILNELSDMLKFDVENGIRSYPVKLSEYLSNALKELQE